MRNVRQWFAIDAKNRAEAAALGLLLLALVIAPFPYGGFLPGGRLRIELVAFLAAAAAALGCDRARLRGAIVPIASAVGIALIGAFQWLPLGRGAVRWLSPASARAFEETESVVRLFKDASPLSWRISIAPDSTAGAILLVLAYLALFSTSLVLVDSRGRRNLLAIVLIASALAHAAWAIGQPVADSRIHGAFVNPNNFAGYLQIALAAALGLLWTEALRNRERGAGLRERAKRVEARAFPFLWRMLVWGSLATALASTRSRAGIAAAAGTTLVALAMMPFHARVRSRRSRTIGWVAIGLAAGLLFVAATAGTAPLLRYLASDPRDAAADTRVILWKSSFEAARDFPVTGSGLGAFREAYRRVQPAEIVGLVEHAHNDALQMLVTGGPAGLALAALGLGTLLVGLGWGWLRQRHSHEGGMLLAGFAALLALLLHGSAEFNMSVPAVPATLAVLLGAAWGARGASSSKFQE
jgi:O-antigen ligase